MSRNVMNQYRFSGTGCVEDNTTLEVGTIRIDGFNERCFSIKTKSGEKSSLFSKDKDYHFTLKVRRDLTTDIDIRLTLRSSATNEKDMDDNYQYLDTVHLPKWSSNENNYIEQKRCAVYLCGVKNKTPGATETKADWFKREIIATGEVEDRTSTKTPEDGKLYYQKDTLGNITYSLYRSSTTLTGELHGSSDGEKESFDTTNTLTRRKIHSGWNNNWTALSQAVVTTSWRASNSEDAYGIFDITFRPLTNTFDRVCAEIVREAIDEQVSFSDTGKGRQLGVVESDCSLAVVNDLVPKLKEDGGMSSITKIGVWGRPGLLMCINGEPIRVGNSGFYEQDSVEVETLGVVVKDGDWSNNFTIDYFGPASKNSGA
jgi:hypothetical protein